MKKLDKFEIKLKIQSDVKMKEKICRNNSTIIAK